MKRLLAALVSALLVCTALAGCSSSGEKFVVLEEDFGYEEYGIGMRRGDNALTLALQEAIDAMIADGTAAKISEKWFGEDKMLRDKPFPREITDTGDDSLQYIKDKGTLILGLDVGFEPMGFYDDSGEIVGFDIDLAKEVAKRLEVELVLQPISWDAKEMELENKSIDVIWNGMSITPERSEAMNISKPYLANRMIVIVKEDSGIKTLSDLAGKKVACQSGSSALDAINSKPEIASTFGELISTYGDNPTAFLDLKSGRVDALVVDEVVGLNLIEKNS
ncbi:MAG: transporter substrate-binding domain-containing protein [Clostridiales bacterium]|jgi:polar amino acid transport system substrate-binding protein|nr:transporter substrate-binding domain-containing protein [Clostridiales bacterium]